MFPRLLLRAAIARSDSSVLTPAAARALLAPARAAPPSRSAAAGQRLRSAAQYGAGHHHPATRARLEAARYLLSTASSGGADAGQLMAAVRKARWMAAPVGAIAGLFGSVVGVGGGVIIVPLIVNACKSIPQRLVSGTSLVAVVSTALASTLTFAQAGLIDPTAALLISPVAMLAAPAGARATARLDTAALKRALGWFLVGVAPLVPLKAYLLQRKGGGTQQAAAESGPDPEKGLSASGPLAPASSAPGEEAAATAVAVGNAAAAGHGQSILSVPAGGAAQAAGPFSLASWLQQQKQALLALPPATVAAMCATGAVAGFASGLLGIGGGTIVTPMLALLTPFSQGMVLGTSLLSMIPPSLAGLVQHQRLGNVDWRMAAGLAAGTALGAQIGSAAAVQAPAGVLEAVFTVGMLFLGRKTLRSARP